MKNILNGKEVFTKNSKHFNTMKNVANFNSYATISNNFWTGNSSGQKNTTEINAKDINNKKSIEDLISNIEYSIDDINISTPGNIFL